MEIFSLFQSSLFQYFQPSHIFTVSAILITSIFTFLYFSKLLQHNSITNLM